jgi:hypothetical protein
MGIVSQGRKDALPVTVGGKEMRIQIPGEISPNQIPSSPKIEPVLSANWIGIAVVEPVSRLRELLEAARKASVKQ